MRFAVLSSGHLLTVCVLCASTLASGPSEPPDSPVKIARVVERELSGTHTVVGTVHPARRSTVGSAVDGRVIEFPVENGDRVAAGDVLARLRTKTLEWQLEAAKAEQRLRDEELAELKNGTDPETVANLEALMKAAEAHRDYTQSQLTRIERLFERGQAATQTQLDEARSQASGALQEHIATKASHDLAVRGPRPEKITQAEARCQAQRAVVSQLEEQIARHTVVAPFDGFIVAEHTELGQWAASGDPIAEVVQLSEVHVQVSVLEGDAAFLRVGQPVAVRVPAAAQQDWQGTVHRIIPQADVRSRTFPVDVRITNRIENDVPVLKSGHLASVQLPTGSGQTALLIPKDALVLGVGETVVYVFDVDSADDQAGTVRPVNVTLGDSNGLAIEVQGELTPGDRVVVEGNERLKPNQRVRIQEEVSYP